MTKNHIVLSSSSNEIIVPDKTYSTGDINSAVNITSWVGSSNKYLILIFSVTSVTFVTYFLVNTLSCRFLHRLNRISETYNYILYQQKRHGELIHSILHVFYFFNKNGGNFNGRHRGKSSYEMCKGNWQRSCIAHHLDCPQTRK